MTQEGSRLRRVAKTLVINGSLVVMSLLLAVGVAEIAIRLVAPQQLIQMRPDLWQPADTLGWVHRPNVKTKINTGERTVSVYTDRDGFRVGAAGRREDGMRVLLLGDSFMEALQVEYEQSLAGLLEARLPDALAQPVVVRNGGIDGWSPSHYLLRARKELPRDDYRLLVVAIYVGNDAQRARTDYIRPRAPVARARFHLPRGFSVKHFVDAMLRPANDALEVRSHLYTFLKNRLSTLRMQAGVSPLYLPPEFLKSEAASERWKIIGDISQDIAELASSTGAKTLFVLIPAAFQVDETKFEQYVQGYGIDPSTVDLDQPTRLVKEQLVSRGLEAIDPLAALRSAHDAGSQLYGSIDQHLTPAGHALIADLLIPIAAQTLSPSARQ